MIGAKRKIEFQILLISLSIIGNVFTEAKLEISRKGEARNKRIGSLSNAINHQETNVETIYSETVEEHHYNVLTAPPAYLNKNYHNQQQQQSYTNFNND